MNKFLIAAVLLFQIPLPMLAEEHLGSSDAELNKQLVEYGIELVRIETTQQAFMKGDTENKHSLVLAKVKLRPEVAEGKAYNPWSTFTPYCADRSPAKHDAAKLHVGIIVLDHLNTITDVLYEGNISIRNSDEITLALVGGDEFRSPNGEADPVFVLSSTGCNDRSLYWNGKRFDWR